MSVRGRSRYLDVGLVVLAAALLVAGRLDLSLGVGVGAMLGWVLNDPVRITWAIFVVGFVIPVTIDFGYPTNASYSLLLILFILAVCGRVLRAERDGLQPMLTAAALLLPLSALLAGLVHWHGIKPIVVGVAPLLCFGVLCWHIIEEARRDPQLIRRIAGWFTWFGVAVAVFAKYQSLSGTWPIFDQLAYDWTYTSQFDPTRSVGISGHPIVYGTFAMGMALVALTIRGRFWYVPFTANLVGLVLSGTRSAWLGMFLALALWLLFQWRNATWRSVASAVAIVAIAFMLVAVTLPINSPAPVSSAPAPDSSAAAPDPSAAGPDSSAAAPDASVAPHPSAASPHSSAAAPNSADPVDAAGSRISDPIESASVNARLTRIRVAWDRITHDWSTVIFGYGPEASVRYLETIGIPDDEAQVFDNTYLSFWYDFGLIGVACLLLVMVALYRRFRSLPPRLVTVGFVVQIFFFDVWLWLGAMAVFLLAVGLAAADNPAWSPRPLRAPLSRRRRDAPECTGEVAVTARIPP